MYKVVVAGSREFDNYWLLERTLVEFLQGKYPREVEIVSGTARGADRLGEQFAKAYRCSLKQFPADWTRLGALAGPIRNQQMLDYADAVVCFWDGRSAGTRNMINITQKESKPLKIVRF